MNPPEAKAIGHTHEASAGGRVTAARRFRGR